MVNDEILDATRRIQSFSENWPHVVNIKCDWPVAHAWLLNKADYLGQDSKEIFTSIRFREYGFKDPKLAMEFKLIFG